VKTVENRIGGITMEKQCAYQNELLRELLCSFEEEPYEQIELLKSKQKRMYQKLHENCARLKMIERALKKENTKEKEFALKAEKDFLQEENNHYQTKLDQLKESLKTAIEEANTLYFNRIFSVLEAIQAYKNLDLSQEEVFKEQMLPFLSQIVRKGNEVLKRMKSYYFDQTLSLKGAKIQEEMQIKIKLFQQFLEELSSQERAIRACKQRENNRRSMELEDSEQELSERAQGYLQEMLQGKKVAIKSADLLLSILAYMIEHYDFQVYYDKIFLFDETLFENETRVIIYHYLENMLAKKDRLTRTRHTKKSPELLHLFAILENKIDDSTEKVFEKEHNQAYFDVLVYLMENETNERYLRKLFLRHKNFANACNKQGLTILEYIVNAFETTTLIKLKNQTKEAMSPLFFQELYKTLVKSPCFEGTPSFQRSIQHRLLEFEQSILKSKYKPERKEEVVHMIQDMLFETKEEKQEEVACQKEVMLHYAMNLEVADRTRKQDQELFTMTISSKDTPYHNCAYSVVHEEGRYWLNVYVTDVSSFIEQEILDVEQLKKKMFSNRKEKEDYLLAPHLVKYFSLEKGRERPVLAYRFLINCRGNVDSLKIERAVIRVDENHTFDEFNQRTFRMQEDIKPFVIVSGWLKEKAYEEKGMEIIRAYETMVENTIGHYFNSNHLSYIYRVCEGDAQEENFRLIGRINHMFYDLKEEDRKAIIGILCEEDARAMYTTRNFGHARLEQKYHSDLLHPLDSYIGMVLQQLTKKTISSSKNYSIEPQELDLLVEQANILKKRR